MTRPLNDRAAPLGVVTLVVALFADESYEGPSEARVQMLVRRRQRIEDYTFEIAAIDEALTKPAGDVPGFLSRTLDARTGAVDRAHRSALEFSQLAALRVLIDRSPDQFAGAARAAIDRMAQARQALQAHLPRR